MQVPDFARKALSEFEAKNLAEYTARSDPCTCHMLEQSPAEHGHSSSPEVLCTLIKNTGLLFSLPHNRWLTGSECLNAQGFPTPDVVNVLGEGIYTKSIQLCSFQVPIVGRRSADMKRQAGNSMATPVCGVVWMYILGFMVQLGA